jgi:hypothetical protein
MRGTTCCEQDASLAIIRRALRFERIVANAGVPNNGTATGTPITRFIHPDHLGSTNAVTDQNGNLLQAGG